MVFLKIYEEFPNQGHKQWHITTKHNRRRSHLGYVTCWWEVFMERRVAVRLAR